MFVFFHLLKVEDYASDGLKRAVNDFFNEDEPGAKELLDWAQKKFDCCGNNGPADFNNATANTTCGLNNGVNTCHKDSNCSKTLYKDGCKSKFSDFIKKNLVVVGVIALSIAFIQVIFDK